MKWSDLIKKRIASEASEQIRTELFCLDWQKDSNSQSPLFRFCKHLEEYGLLKNSDVNLSAKLMSRCLDTFYEFSHISKNEGFNLNCCARPPVQVVLAISSNGQSKGIIYFTSAVNPSTSRYVTGFATQDERWLQLIKEIISHLRNTSRDVLKDFKFDTRSSEQRERCNELLNHRESNPTPYTVKINSHEVIVNPGVFPPEKGIGTSILLDSIEHVFNIVSTRWIHDDIIGIDIGTGTGILAMELARHCNEVYATDIQKAAATNALENFNRISTTSVCKIHNFEGNLFDNIQVDLKNSHCIVVFNYPFYPSPIASYGPNDWHNAGLPIVDKFLKDANAKLGDNAILLLPECSIAQQANPASIAHTNGYSVQVIRSSINNNVTTNVLALTKVKAHATFSILSESSNQ